MRNLIFIHGWESFETWEQYLKFLENTYVTWQAEPWTPEEKTSWIKEIAKKWYANWWIVYMPVFPNKLNSRYDEWKIVFEGILSQLNENDEVTFIWGSLGGCFLLKYFSEIKTSSFVIPTKEESLSPELMRNTWTNTHKTSLKEIPTGWQKKIQINEIHLIAACISEWDFTTPTNYESLQQLGNQVHIWHAEDDKVVPFSVGQDLSKILPDAQTHFFSSEKWYGHFHGIEKFPELEEILI